MGTLSIKVGKYLPIGIIKRNWYNFRGHLGPNTGVLIICVFVIRGFSFPQNTQIARTPCMLNSSYVLPLDWTQGIPLNKSEKVTQLVEHTFQEQFLGKLDFTDSCSFFRPDYLSGWHGLKFVSQTFLKRKVRDIFLGFTVKKGFQARHFLFANAFRSTRVVIFCLSRPE